MATAAASAEAGAVFRARSALPRGFDLVPFLGVASYFVCAAFLPRVISPSSPSYALLQGSFPGGVDGFAWLVRTIFWPVVGIHLVEAWWFDKTRCRELGVARGRLVWWLWMAAVFTEGVTAFRRFDRLAGKRGTKKAQ